MCGIAGQVAAPGGCISPTFVPTALRLLEHRGPDDCGYLLQTAAGIHLARDWSDSAPPADLALVHRRLSILDLSPAGWQPMAGGNGRYYVVFNGEIYNYIELREELAALGHVFHSRSDTEVLLAACAQWGPAAVTRFVGMFAFALLDTRKRRLFLARDYFGIKPLYYTCTDEGLAFASEMKVLLELSGVRRQANPERVYAYLRYGNTDYGGDTMLADVRQLPPAHYLEIDLDDPRPGDPVCYWQLDIGQTADISFAEATRRVRDLFVENIHLHLRSDVPVGTALSGGIDSSAIVAAMRHLEGGNLQLHTFSFIADDVALSEEKWIDLVVQATGATAHKVRPGPNELLADLDRLIYVQDEPFGSTSIYAQFRVFQLARQAGIKVMLDGQGADEMLAGYRFYLAARFASLVRRGQWLEAGRFLRQASRWPGVRKSWLLAFSGEFLLPQAWQEPVRRLVGKDLLPAWMNARWFADRGVVPTVMNYSKTRDVLRAHLARSLTTQMLPHLLRYEDRNSMAFSIESRVPFLTPRLAEFLFTLPEEYLVDRQGTSKAVLRAALRGIVPDAILDRRDKLGFVTPERNWLSTLEPWVQRTLGTAADVDVPALNLAGARAEWVRCKASGTPMIMRAWRWLNLIEWTRRFQVRYD